RDLQNLQTGEAIVRIEGPSGVCGIQIPMLPRIEAADAEGRRQKILAESRRTYATSRTNLTHRTTIAPGPVVEAVPARSPQVEPQEVSVLPPEVAAVTTTIPTSRRKTRTVVPVTQEMGVGGQEHKY